MKITLEYRNPTPSHVDIAVFINGRNCGTLRVGQDDVIGLQQIISHGCAKGIDEFLGRGRSLPPDSPEG
jgi:hypothetical protein